VIPLPSISIAAAAKLGLTLIVAFAIAMIVHDRNRWKIRAAERQVQIVETRAAFEATVASYRSAAERALRQDAANAARVRTEQTEINERTKNDYQTRIAAARASAQRLRAQSVAAAGPGCGAGAPMPGLSFAAEGTSQATGQDGLPAGTSAELRSSDALIATEQAIQLDELIHWVQSQSEVRTGDR
jgi:hypothetical protein